MPELYPTNGRASFAISDIITPYENESVRESNSLARTCSGDIYATRHLTNTSAGLHSSQDKASQESSQHIVHNGQPACGSFVARQTASQSSNVGDTVASGADLVFCCFG